jgi:thiamine-phosphate pyrophosphorylase
LTQEVIAVANSIESESNPRIIVNDRLDVALAVGAAGVHLTERSLSVRDTKALLPLLPLGKRQQSFLVGASCHSLEKAVTAASEGADYLFFGPVFATPSKEQYGPPQGPERLKEASAAVSIPVLAIGGITAENAVLCLEAGAAGIAAIRLFQDLDAKPLDPFRQH